MVAAAGAAPTTTTVYELTAVVHEGRHFPVDSSFEVKGVFDAEESATGLTRASANPVWGGSLVWRRDADQIRKLQSSGAKLKLTGERSVFKCPKLTARFLPNLPTSSLSSHLYSLTRPLYPPLVSPALAVTDESRRLGWIVLDMRAMKQAALLYAPDGDNPGKWMQLSSPTFKAGPYTTPQLFSC